MVCEHGVYMEAGVWRSSWSWFFPSSVWVLYQDCRVCTVSTFVCWAISRATENLNIKKPQRQCGSTDATDTVFHSAQFPPLPHPLLSPCCSYEGHSPAPSVPCPLLLHRSHRHPEAGGHHSFCHAFSHVWVPTPLACNCRHSNINLLLCVWDWYKNDYKSM